MVLSFVHTITIRFKSKIDEYHWDNCCGWFVYLFYSCWYVRVFIFSLALLLDSFLPLLHSIYTTFQRANCTFLFVVIFYFYEILVPHNFFQWISFQLKWTILSAEVHLLHVFSLEHHFPSFYFILNWAKCSPSLFSIFTLTEFTRSHSENKWGKNTTESTATVFRVQFLDLTYFISLSVFNLTF